MGRHSLFPGYIKIGYTSNGHPHHQVLPINDDPTPVGDSFTIPTRASGAVDWQTAVADWLDLVKAIFDGASNFSTAELFNYEAFPGPSSFLQGITIDIDGSDGGTAQPFEQVVMPFKGVGGTSLRPYFMEAVIEEDEKTPYAGLIPQTLAIANYVLGDDAWMCTRGGGFATVSLGSITKNNDKLRKRYLNP